MEELEAIARSEFGLEVARRLPITESFSSSVSSFIATDDRHYVLKRHWARNKAEREAAALRALAAHPDVPALLAVSDRDDTLTLLIEGLDATPWTNVANATPDLLRHLGRAMALLHQSPAESFDGEGSWHDLLVGNARRYATVIGVGDQSLAERASALLQRHLDEVPPADSACLVHFDLRPGNLLVSDGRLIGIIDFESSRGGHPSMDFFKLWQQVAPHVPGGLAEVVHGYAEITGPNEQWLDAGSLPRLMQIYAAYHGLAGLAWCSLRDDFSGDFPTVNRTLIHDALAALN